MELASSLKDYVECNFTVGPLLNAVKLKTRLLLVA